MKGIQTVKDIDVKGQRVLVRVDFNVPLKDGKVGDNSRLKAHLPTLNYLREQGAKIILISHLGRPDGKVNSKYSLKPVVSELSKLLDAEIAWTDDCVGDDTDQAVDSLKDGEVLLLENLRFHSGEEANDDSFSQQLAKHADVYINDAFATAHRSHASNDGIIKHMATYGAGLLMAKELEALHKALDAPKKPLAVIIGGAKISSKIGVLKNLAGKADVLMIGGAMANTFLAAQGHDMGKSLYESERLEVANDIMQTAAARGCRVLLPVDVRAASKLEDNIESQCVSADNLPKDMMALDIGEKTVTSWQKEIMKAGTIFWNGPMGVFEVPPFNKGTLGIAQAVKESDGYSVAGGGDTLAAIAKCQAEEALSYLSTGGGALLEFLEHGTLPALEALTHKKAA